MKIQFPSGFAVFLADTEADEVIINDREIMIINSSGRKKVIMVPRNIFIEQNGEKTLEKSKVLTKTANLSPMKDLVRSLYTAAIEAEEHLAPFHTKKIRTQSAQI